MTARWWGPGQVICPKCEKTETFHMETHFSADGQIRFKMFCQACKNIFNVDYFASQLVHIALTKDMEAEGKKAKESRIVKPPLALPPSVMTEEDKKWERDIGIDPDSEDNRAT